MLTGNVTRISSAESALCSSWLLPKNRIKRWFRVTLLSQHHVLFFFSLPLKCYGCFPPLPSPLSAEVIFYPQESHYLASPSPPSSSLQLHRLTAILLCHSNLFFWHHYFALTHGLWASVSVHVWVHAQPAFMGCGMTHSKTVGFFSS